LIEAQVVAEEDEAQLGPAQHVQQPPEARQILAVHLDQLDPPGDARAASAWADFTRLDLPIPRAPQSSTLFAAIPLCELRGVREQRVA
jgi:hypothetical protein